jgi:hypothetical protein
LFNDRYSALLCGAILLQPHFSYAKSSTTFSVEAEAYSQAVSIDAFTDDWKDPHFESGDHAFAQGRVQLTQQYKELQYALFWRYDYLLSFSPDTAKLYYEYANHLNPADHQKYNLNIRVNQLEALGFYVGSTKNIYKNWKLSYGINMLKGQHMIQGSMDGSALTKKGTDLQDTAKQLLAHLDYFYDEPQLHEEELGWTPDQDSGLGASIDLHLLGFFHPEWLLDLRMRDLGGKMYWDDAPRTQYNLRYDVDTRPLYDINGQLSNQQSLWQKIPWRVDIGLTFKPSAAPSIYTDVQLQINSINSLYQLGIYKNYLDHMVGLKIEPQTKSFGIDVEHHGYGFRYLTDRLNSNQAHREIFYFYSKHDW